MADYTQTPQGGYAAHQHPEYAVAPSKSLGKLTNFAGAAISLALVVGVGVWGYKLLVRDVSGIPIVRAAAGEMRVRPEEPGGEFAQHQGLSVNSVAAIGAAGEQADELRLAPRPIDLAEEDQPMLSTQEVSMEEADSTPPQAPDTQEIAAAFENGSVDDIVAQLTNGVTPMEVEPDEAEPVLASVDTQGLIGLDADGAMRTSLRPSLRPQRAARTTAVDTAVAAAVSAVAGGAASGGEINAATLPAGTRLVQLGAFDTPEIARTQWGKLNARFAPFMEGKNRIVMEAKSGGRTFYRLRAEGFEDIGDARRFCSALVAESVDCIPVVTR